MRERLRIHHGIGSRVLFDSNPMDARFSVEQQPTGWQFRVYTEEPLIEEVLRLKDEINVFIFREEDGVAIEKVWYYTDGDVKYDDTEHCLLIHAQSYIAYDPNGFTDEH